MKRLVLMLGLAMGLGLAAASTDAQAADCGAYTYCPNRGYPIFCETWGAGCTWYVQPYQYVRCTGFDFYGRWVNYFLSCY